MALPVRDERTTPGWLRAPALGLLGLVATWFALSYSFALGAPQPAWAEPHWWVWWFANWEMFTLLDTDAIVVRADALYDGKWRPIDLEELFPTRWESGPRYGRSAFYMNGEWMKVLGDSTCGRLEEKPERVRFYRLVWRKTPGVPSTTPPKNARRKPISEFRCGDPVQRPTGVRL